MLHHSLSLVGCSVSRLLADRLGLTLPGHETEAETVKVPSMAESITEGTLKQWLKQEGDFVEADEEVATIETDKVRSSRAYLSARKLVNDKGRRSDTSSHLLTD